MEGHGVTNYSNDTPSYAFSASTTEFDDALIQRGIVTKEQALLAKGMSAECAQRLLTAANNPNSNNQESTDREKTTKLNDSNNEKEEDSDDDDDSDDDEFLEDDFLTEYRQKRLAELQQQQQSARRYGEVVFIDRTEWTRHVNEASQDTWVVVCLTSSDTERTGSTEAAVKQLAFVYKETKFVLIPSHSAIPDWPEQNLPSLFLYRHGKMQHELLRLPVNTTQHELEERLRELAVLENDES